nr:immunoglobulin light chain junction region [Macaca mulatta]MOY10270.1 immunoglobulin light chain junction region [Macaca mulatta]MOY10314.1 immunoglobulin light chain junction region [Macaca mulatta]
GYYCSTYASSRIFLF